MLQQELRDLVVAVEYCVVERLASRRDLFLGQVGIGAVLEEQLHDVEPTDCRGVGERGAAAEIAALVTAEPVGQRGVLAEQLPHAIEIAGVTCGRQIDDGAARSQVRHHLRRRCRPVARDVAPAAIEVVAVGQMNRLRAVHAPRVDIGAALQQLVDRLDLPRHRRPVDWLTGSAVALREERGLGIEQLAHPRQIVLPQRERNRFALPRGVERRLERLGQQPLHLHVATIARNLQRAVVEPQVHRVAIVLEQESRDVDAILANGEVERLAIGVVGARQRRIPGDERASGVEIAGNAGLDQRPEVGSAARRPQQLVIGSQRGGLQHATGRLERLDVVDELRPALEAVRARQRVLRRGELHRRIGDAQHVEVFSGLLAQLLERRAFRQITGGDERHDDLLSDIARVRSPG